MEATSLGGKKVVPQDISVYDPVVMNRLPDGRGSNRE